MKSLFTNVMSIVIFLHAQCLTTYVFYDSQVSCSILSYLVIVQGMLGDVVNRYNLPLAVVSTNFQINPSRFPKISDD